MRDDVVSEPEQLLPPLKWAGGKRWQVPLLKSLWHEHAHRRLVEPFAGGLAITLGLQPHKALINDINVHLMNFYRALQEGLEITCPLHNDSSFYYAARNEFNEMTRSGNHESNRSAVLFYYLNRTGYNGLCRFNAKGEYNVPFGRYSSITYRKSFLEYRPTLQDWALSNSSFDCLDLDSSDFVYADPPYDVEFRQYSSGGFSWEQQVSLANSLSQHPGPVVLANQATERVVGLYERLGYTLLYLKGPRRISCTGDRQPASEVLALKNLRVIDVAAD